LSPANTMSIMMIARKAHKACNVNNSILILL
jgi:hypothetical protein